MAYNTGMDFDALSVAECEARYARLVMNRRRLRAWLRHTSRLLRNMPHDHPSRPRVVIVRDDYRTALRAIIKNLHKISRRLGYRPRVRRWVVEPD